MTENSTKTESTKKSERTDKTVDVVHRAADLSDEVLKSVESGQRAAIDAVRKFVDTVDEAIPARSDSPSGRETVIDAALDMADRLVTTQYEFLRSVVRSADRTLRKPDDAKSNDCRVARTVCSAWISAVATSSSHESIRDHPLAAQGNGSPDAG